MQSSRHHPRFIAATACLLALTCYALAAIPAIHNGLRGVSPLFQDDAYYYLVTASHFISTGVFTFDGVNETNGFHPLWMAIVVGLFKLCGSGCIQEHQIFAVKLTETLLRGFAIVLCVGFYAAEAQPRRAVSIGYLGIAVVLLCPAFVIFEQGMETTLATLLLVLVIHAWIAGNALGLGILLALLFLARLDTAIFVAAPILVRQLLIERGRPKRLVVSAMPLAVVFAAYTGYNLWHTGHAVPISGAIRSSFPAISWHGSHLLEPINIASMFGWRTLISANMILVSSALLLGFVLLVLGRPRRELRGKLLLIGLVAAWLVANLLLFQSWEKSIDPRYLALPLAASAFFLTATLALACERPGGGWRDGLRFVPIGALIGLLALEGIVFGERFQTDYGQTSDPVMALFRSVGEAVPATAVIAGTDVGALAFWTGRRVINLDGVINNYAYQNYLRDGRLREYLREQGVGYIATPLSDHAPAYTGRPIEPMYRHVIDAAATHGTIYDQHDYYVYSYLYHVYSDRIPLKPAQEVFRRFIGNAGGADIAYVIYRIGSRTAPLSTIAPPG